MQTDYLTKILNPTDKTYFTKAVQIYYFFKQELINPLEIDISAKLEEGANLTYSLLRHYLVNESFELSYLQEINELLREINETTKSNETILQIPATQVDEIELQELVPMQFTDVDTQEKLQVLFHTKEGVILWNLIHH
ncbi:hypothetical protein EP331_10645 [bacterium]|nr:MAG: hypothetical protein EP331_10645 [bacterium]